jgi:ubiquinol-cytochrome c reductase cytochrome c1 subunit
MVKLKKTARLLVLAVFFVSASGYAAGGGHVDSADIDPDNVASLQRGARNFMNYCSGCHSAQYVRYSTIGKHLGLSDEQLIDNLMFNAEKTFETIRTSMSPEDALRWYGVAPPDMSLIARSKGVDYIYTFLKGFYVSPDSPTGVNNVALAGTSMPHVLGELQGYQRANFKVEEGEDGSVTTTFEGFEKLSEGSLDAEEYDDFVRDTVNFLAYISEPIRSDRIKLGVWVLMFLVFFYILASMLKKQIWKDVK